LRSSRGSGTSTAGRRETGTTQGVEMATTHEPLPSAAVNTITGLLDSSALGRTLSHEHLCSGSAGMERLPGFLSREELVERNLTALKRARQSGIDTIIDVTPFDLGRQVWLFEELAERRDEYDVNIVCATGVYRWVPPIYFGWDEDEIARLFVSEITEGIEGTGIKAGVIKIAWDIEARLDGGTRSPRRLLEKTARAAARAAKATGTPISCHTLASDELGIPLLDLFEDEGVDLRAVTIGHSNDTSDIDYLDCLARRGATIGLDRLVRTDPDYFEPRADVALELIREGFAEQICLGHDGSPASFWRGWNPDPRPDCWTLVPDVQVPWLLDHGATEDDIDAMLVRSIRATFDHAAAMRAVGLRA
jgi:phosphotriesterase-related protein